MEELNHIMQSMNCFYGSENCIVCKSARKKLEEIIAGKLQKEDTDVLPEKFEIPEKYVKLGVVGWEKVRSEPDGEVSCLREGYIRRDTE